MNILLSKPHMSGREMAYIEEAFESNWIAPLGPNVNAFEAEVAAYADHPYALATSSGTAALHWHYLRSILEQGTQCSANHSRSWRRSIQFDTSGRFRF